MSNRVLFLFTFVVVVGIGALFFLNYASTLGVKLGEKYLNFDDIRGMAVEHDNLLYTLNFSQQNSVAEYINQSQTMQGGLRPRKRGLDVQKILIYRFGRKPIVDILPLDYDEEDNLIFSAPALYSEGVLKDTSQGKLKQLLSRTYDS